MAFDQSFERVVGTVANTLTAIYTPPSGRGMKIVDLIFCNLQGTAETVNLAIVHRDTTSTKILYDVSLAAKGTIGLDFGGHGLEVERGETLKASTTTNNGVAFTISAQGE